MFSEVICCLFWFCKVGFLGESGLGSKGVCGGGCWRFLAESRVLDSWWRLAVFAEKDGFSA